MSVVLAPESPPLMEDSTGAIRVGDSRVLLELVIRAFQDGASPETIVQRYDTLSLADVYSTIGYFLRHPENIEIYLAQREEKTKIIREFALRQQPDMASVRARLMSRQQEVSRHQAAGNNAKTVD